MFTYLQRPVANRLIFTLFFIGLFYLSKAQTQTDSITLSLQDAEKIFIDSNLAILAAHYNVDANKALIEQAKKWDNPVLITDQNIYSNNKFFEHGKNAAGDPTGQFFIQVEQLIRTAGKRSKLVDLVSSNEKISELQLQDVLQSLRYQLHQDYYNVVQQLSVASIYTKQLAQLKQLENGMQQQLQAGNIAQKDFLRIQALRIGLEQDILDLNRNIADAETEMRTLLMIHSNTFIKPADALQPEITLNEAPDAIVEQAKQSNAEYLLQQAQLIYQQKNLVYQKSLRTPDVTVGPEYDHNSNYTPHYVGLTLSLPLPIFDNNKGNIHAAEYTVKQQQAYTSEAEVELNNNITNAYNKLLLTQQQNSSMQKEFYNNYGNIFNNMLKSYEQRQIGLLEFLDFFDTYKDMQLRLLQQQLNLQLAKEELNYYAGTDIIK